jgi:hypothetical protein
MSKLSDTLLGVAYNLVPAFGEENFDDVFELAAADFTVGDQYKIKNELVRITEPCEKVIDLRGKVSGKCRKFLHKGRIHYLDEQATEMFEAGLDMFGQYTLGVWEDVNNSENNFHVLQAKAEQARLNALKSEQNRKADKLQNILAAKLQYSDANYPVHVIRFGDYFNREEERMNYSVPAQLTFEDGRQMEAVTKDLSLKGTYLRVGLSEVVEMDELVRVKLAQQPKGYDVLVGEGVLYQVKRIEYIDDVIWLGLNYIDTDNEEAYTKYVRDLIITNKFVYKVNLDSAIDAALKQGYEQVFFARTVSMPLFVETLGSQFRLRYALTSGLNDENLRFFCNESNQQHLTSLFASATIRGLVNSDTAETILYSFSHKVQNKLLYFAAFELQLLEDPDLHRLFLGYGSKKDSWQVHKIERVAVDKKNAELLFVVPNRKLAQDDEPEEEEAEQVGLLEKPIEVGNITHVLLMTYISDKKSTEAYQKRGFDSDLMPQITQFQLNYNDSGLPLRWVNFGLDELRHEPRFAYKTKVIVKLPNGMKLECTSEDFSARGIQVKLPRPVEVEPLGVIHLAFPLLQKITRALQLIDLEYRVVRTENDQKTLYLQAVEFEDVQHHGVKFFRDLIKQNRNKLRLLCDSNAQQQLTKTLKNLYQKELATVPFYLNRVNGQLRVTKFVNSERQHPILEQLKIDEFVSKVNIATLLANPAFAAFIKSGNSALKTGDRTRSIDLYVSCLKGVEPPKNVLIKTDFELNNPLLQKEFITEALGAGQFYCIRVFLSQVERVELRKIADELEYIHHYAQHKSKHIAQLLIRINNVGELVDITEYVLSYLEVSGEVEKDVNELDSIHF